MNSFLLSFAALLILVLGALFAVPLVVDWNDYRPVFEAQATKLLGREVKVGGQVHMVLLPAPELRFDDVKVADAEGHLDRPLLAAKSFEAWLNIGALMTGAIEARKITITDPVLRLELKADGSGNWAGLGRPGERLPFAPKEVQLDSVDVTGGRIELTKAGAPLAVLDNVEGEANATSLTGPYKVSAAYDFQGRRQELRFSTNAADASGLFHIKSALRDPDRSTVYLLDGEVTGLSAKPNYHGNIIIRVARAASPDTPPQGDTAAPDSAQTGEDVTPEEAALIAADNASALELKGEFNATPDRAELPNFELTVHAKGRPQMLKGKLALDFGDHPKAEGELSARWIDVDALLAAANGQGKGEPDLSPSAALLALADTALKQAAEIDQGNLSVAIEQASLGGDLVGEIDLGLTASGGSITVTRLSAKLPGENRLEASGTLESSEAGPVFAGPVKLEGSKLKTLTRWASGDRDMSGQASVGAFALSADAVIGGGALKLDNATGELSGTKFKGWLNYRDGDKRKIDLALDSDRLDLKQVLGEDVAWRSWLPASSAEANSSAAKDSNLLAALRDDELHVSLRVGELLLPNIPSGKLDANFGLAQDTLDVTSLDFAAAGALTLSGKGRIEHVSAAPSGRVDFALNAANAESLRVAADLIGLPESIAHSKHLASLAPMDVTVGLVAAGEGNTTKTSLEVNGKAGGADATVKGDAKGEPAKLADADINLTADVSGDHPQAVLGLLLPSVADDKLAAAASGQGKLSFELHGVPKTNLTGKLSLETPDMKLAFDGGGAFKDEGIALTGKGTAASPNAALGFVLLGLEASPGATGAPISLAADIAKTGDTLEFKAVKGQIAGEPVEGGVRFDLGGDKTKFDVDAKAGTVSLPVLLGALVAWQRTPSTEEMLGTVGTGTADVWPSRGFALGPLDRTEGDIKLTAKALTLGAPFRVDDATLAARVDKDGLSIAGLKGQLFGGTLVASGRLSPRAAGAELNAQADLKGGKLELLSKSVAGSILAKGPFAVSFNVSGEGLSPPGLVAGLSGEGSFTLDAGVVQALTPEPLKRVAIEAAKTKKLKDKEQILALTSAVRDKLTKGTYKYAAVTLPFDVKNGTLKLKPGALSSKLAETSINGYVELASLRLDSEWEVKLQGNGDVPPVSLVFAGPLSNAASITPAIDTAAVETYLTMRRMQEDVEKLENLDVSGKTPPPPEPQAEAAPEPEPEAEPELPAETEAPPAPPAESPSLKPKVAPPSAPSAKKETSAPHAADLEPKKQSAPAASEPAAPTAKTEPQAPRAADLEPKKETTATVPASSTAPSSEPALPWQNEQKPELPAAGAEPPSTPAASGDANGTPATTTGAEATPPVTPKPRPHKPAPAPDDWKKGVGIFGGG